MNFFFTKKTVFEIPHPSNSPPQYYTRQFYEHPPPGNTVTTIQYALDVEETTALSPKNYATLQPDVLNDVMTTTELIIKAV